ncbi:hypothetical protein [Aureimonas sp. AU20]|uniref:hypothetical protein n=1 Tax=Aureimonas sp. AU20 TaxID=1349819 RepID=UPI0007220BF0|nr:hypothetical protein [Aureimonas sp. AU20]ALN73589.1 hypothetical protein M673_12745 [Aureimonas sp. AU20]
MSDYLASFAEFDLISPLEPSEPTFLSGLVSIRISAPDDMTLLSSGTMGLLFEYAPFGSDEDGFPWTEIEPKGRTISGESAVYQFDRRPAGWWRVTLTRQDVRFLTGRDGALLTGRDGALLIESLPYAIEKTGGRVALLVEKVGMRILADNSLDVERFASAIDARFVCLPTNRPDHGETELVSLSEDALPYKGSGVGFQTVAKPFAGKVKLAITGTVGAIGFLVERSTIDPATGTPNWHQHQFGGFKEADASTGYFDGFHEPGLGWWRVYGVLNGGRALNANLRVVLTGENERVIAPSMVATFTSADGKPVMMRKHFTSGTSNDWLHWGRQDSGVTHPMQVERVEFMNSVRAEIARRNAAYSFTLATFDEFGTALAAIETIVA